LQFVTQVPASGMTPHTLGVPAPPQVKPVGHPPQSNSPPQPLSTLPQYVPVGEWSHTVGVHTPESSAAPQRCSTPLPAQV
jgi:hypothetical protein